MLAFLFQQNLLARDELTDSEGNSLGTCMIMHDVLFICNQRETSRTQDNDGI